MTVKRSIALSEVLSRTGSLTDLDCHDDIPPLSTQESSLEIWKSLLEYNSPHFGDKVSSQQHRLNRDLILWLCSLNYSRGTGALIHVTGDPNFVENHVNLFLINLNYDIVRSYVGHRVGRKLVHILDYTLDIRVRYDVHPRFRHLLTQEHKVKKWIDNYDGIQDSLCYMVYYLNRLNVKFDYPFERMDSYVQYINYATRKKYLGGLMSSPRWKDVLDQLTSRHSIDALLGMDVLKTRYYDVEAYDTVRELMSNGTEKVVTLSPLFLTLTTTRSNPTKLVMTDELVNGTHMSVLRREHGLTTELTPSDTGTIQELLVSSRWCIFYNDVRHLCWPQLYVDQLYLKSVLLYLRGGHNGVSFRVSSSRILEPCGVLLSDIRRLDVDVKVDLDYVNTPTDILHDLLANFVDDAAIRIPTDSSRSRKSSQPTTLRELILYHKNPILISTMSTRPSQRRTLRSFNRRT